MEGTYSIEDLQKLVEEINEKFPTFISDDHVKIEERIVSLLKPIKSEKDWMSIDKWLENSRKRVASCKELVFINKMKGLTKKQKSIMLLMEYLAISESIFSEFVQFITFILIKNHHDIYHPYGMKFVTRFEELDKIPLFIKLPFLDRHEFKEVTSGFDRKLRNSIAHMKYDVGDNGEIQLNDGKLEQVELETKFDDLLGVILTLIVAFVNAIVKEFEEL